MTNPQPQTEVWQRGPIADVPALLQPVAHALLQAQEELDTLMKGFADDKLWERPAGVASAGFHLQHLSGVLDRVFTYAKGQLLTEHQLKQLRDEDIAPNAEWTVEKLLERFRQQVANCLQQLKETDETTLTDFRGVGRKLLPSTVIGLLVHGAEHTMRHLGQLHVTVRVVGYH